MAAMMMNERWAAKNLLADRQIPKSIVFALHSIDIRLLLKGPICAKEPTSIHQLHPLLRNLNAVHLFSTSSSSNLHSCLEAPHMLSAAHCR